MWFSLLGLTTLLSFFQASLKSVNSVCFTANNRIAVGDDNGLLTVWTTKGVEKDRCVICLFSNGSL